MSPEASSPAAILERGLSQPTWTRGAREVSDASRVNLDDGSLYVSPNLARVEFSRRVLEEAADLSHPLLERVKFLSIFGSNIDEIFMLRVAELQEAARSGSTAPSTAGLSPAAEIAEIRTALLPLLDQASACWRESLLPELAESGIRILAIPELSRRQARWVEAYFDEHAFPVLTPLAVDPGHPFPHISNLSMNLEVRVHDRKRGDRLARLKVPDLFPRLLQIPSGAAAPVPEALGLPGEADFVWMEDVVAAHLQPLFRGLEVVAANPFRVTRDASIKVHEDDAGNLLTEVEETVGRRRFGPAVRLEVLRSGVKDPFHATLVRHLGLGSDQVFATDGPLGVVDLWQLVRLERPDLKDKPFHPAVPASLSGAASILGIVRRRDILLYHPYNSFDPIVDFVREAARDPHVIGIKQTLYRIDRNSPIVAALLDAAVRGKQVAVIVELKARFDEERNIAWARALERAGVHVTYGLAGLKVHAKMCLVVRREGDRIARYVHLGTGNYNTETARIYADLGILTADPRVGADATELFNALTGYSRGTVYRRILVAPGELREAFLRRIDREIRRQRGHGDGHLAFKMNALEDKECIKALYRASQAGVRIDLQVRGFCCLRPGIPGVSETITVTSVVGRFLEHARIYYFRNGGDEEILIGSADMMPRNLDRRVELLFPVRDAAMRAAIRNRILAVHLGDTAKARRMRPDGTYERLAAPDARPFNSQEWLIANRDIWNRSRGTEGREREIPPFPGLRTVAWRLRRGPSRRRVRVDRRDR